MIQVEPSNIWSCISLPELLGREKDIFDAHLRLRSNEAEDVPAFGWLGQSDSVTAKMLHAISKAAQTIRNSCQTLVVVGSGSAWLAAKAALRLLGAVDAFAPRILFAGDNLSSRDWVQLCDKLGSGEYCLHLIGSDADALSSGIASRVLRWMNERRSGERAKSRIFITAQESSPLAHMAQEEGYTLLSLPEAPEGAWSALSASVFLPLAVAGIDPLAMLEGAAGAYHDLDVRAFENPVWMYAGARLCLTEQGYTEILGTFEPDLAAFGTWWQDLFSRRSGCGTLCVPMSLPQQTASLDAAVCAGKSRVFETLLRLEASLPRKISVEMDWHDYDGLGYLSGKTLCDVEQTAYEALVAAHADLEVPIISIEAGQSDARTLGALFYFFELAAALCAELCGKGFGSSAPQPTAILSQKMLGKTDL
ncbi:MAG: hypothetical protein IIY04_05240 [Oscillospiraceae bacterium]|nr:hypothetical protein [Oscillospiraceae bacterium]